MDHSELKDILKAECERFFQIEVLSDEEKKKYAVGIAKLEKRIGELRAALSFTLDDFRRMLQEDTRSATLASHEAAALDYDLLGKCIDEAGEAWKHGDIDRHSKARKEILRVITVAQAGGCANG